MNMLIKLAVLALSSAIAGLAAAPGNGAQPNIPRNKEAEHAYARARLAVIDQNLNLTADQKTKIKALRGDTTAAAQVIRKNAALTPEQRRAQVDAAHKDTRAQIRALLTPEQQIKLTQLETNPRQVNLQARNRVRTEALFRELALTPEQKAKIRTTRVTAAGTSKQIRADKALTPEQRKSQLATLQKTARSEIQSILSPEQKAKLIRVRQRLLAPLGPLG